MSSQQEHHERGIHHRQPARPKTWDVDYTTTDFDYPDGDNPLAAGVYCPTCLTRLQVRGATTTACPICPPEAAA